MFGRVGKLGSLRANLLRFDPSSFNEAWTVTGKTNEDADRAAVKNLTGNGNDLVLYNFLFAENSGYGLYAHNWNKWNLPAERAEGTKQNNLVNITRVVSTSAVILFFQTTDPSVGGMNVTIPSFKIRVSGLTDGQLLRYKFDKDSFEISEDGIYTLPSLTGAAGSGGYYFYGFFFTKIQDSCDITIEQIPDYEGYLVTDGVDDSVKSSNFNLYENFTLVGQWKFIPEGVEKIGGIIKSSKLYIYNTLLGISIYINTENVSNKINSIKSLKAVCSDGRCYDENWNEIVVNVGEQGRRNNPLLLGISGNGTQFVKIAFKNCAFYSEQTLTKEQCITAYNYLQTLKAK